MKANKISVTLEGRGLGSRKHSFDIVEEDNQILLKVGEQVIATLNVATMTKEVSDAEGDYHQKPSDNFYLTFEATDPVAKRECAAMAWVEAPSPIQV